MPPKTRKQQTTVIVAQGGAGDVLCHGPLLEVLVHRNELVVVLAGHPEMLAGTPGIELLSLRPQADWRNDGRRIWMEVRSGAWEIKRWSGSHPYDGWAGIGEDRRTLVQIVANIHGVEVDADAVPVYRPTVGEVGAANRWFEQFPPGPVVLVHWPTKTCFGAKRWNVGAKPEFAATFVQIGSSDEERIPWATSALGMPLRDTAALLFSRRVSAAILGESVFAHIAASSPLGKRAITVFTCTDPHVFGHKSSTRLSAPNGCEYWPCNGPVGGIGSLSPGFLNLTTGKPMIYWCRQQQKERLCGPSWNSTLQAVQALGGI